MRTRKIIGISAVFAFLLALVAAFIAFSEPEPLSIAVGPVSYKAYRQIVATFVLTNTSKVSIEYSKLNRARIRVLGERGWRDFQWTGTRYSMPTVVDPGLRDIQSSRPAARRSALADCLRGANTERADATLEKVAAQTGDTRLGDGFQNRSE